MSQRFSTLTYVLWLGVHLVLLVALGLSYLLPIVDHHAVERDPFHTHLILAGTATERYQALLNHTHDPLTPHTHDPRTGVSVYPDTSSASGSHRVLSVSALAGLNAQAFGQPNTTLFVPVLLTLLLVLVWQGRVHALAPAPRRISLPRLDPPPRLPNLMIF